MLYDVADLCRNSFASRRIETLESASARKTSEENYMNSEFFQAVKSALEPRLAAMSRNHLLPGGTHCRQGNMSAVCLKAARVNHAGSTCKAESAAISQPAKPVRTLSTWPQKSGICVHTKRPKSLPINTGLNTGFLALRDGRKGNQDWP